MRYINGTRLDDRIVRTDWDVGFKEGRQYGRGKTGGQVRIHQENMSMKCVPILKPHFYIAELGYAGVYLFFLFLLLAEAVLTCTHNLCFEQK